MNFSNDFKIAGRALDVRVAEIPLIMAVQFPEPPLTPLIRRRTTLGDLVGCEQWHALDGANRQATISGEFAAGSVVTLGLRDGQAVKVQLSAVKKDVEFAGETRLQLASSVGGARWKRAATTGLLHTLSRRRSR
jgi:hypothetical protein